MRRLLFLPLITALALVALSAAPAGAVVTGPLVQVSGASPFGALTNCGNFPTEFPGFPPSVPYVNGEVEPWVDVNPTNPDNIVAVWQQDRWSDGGSRGTVAGVSLDGGSNWQIVPVPGITDCTGGPWERASDPWVSFGPDGTLHQMSLVFMTDPPPGNPGGFGPNGMVVSKSEDGGLTWSTPILIAQDDEPRFLHDKNSLTADPTDANYVYAVWDRLDVLPSFSMHPDRATLAAFKGPILFARSTDGGDTWEPARKLYDPGGINQTISNQVVVLPDGTVIDFFTELLNLRNDDGAGQPSTLLSFKYSENKGERWLPRGRPMRTNHMFSLGIIPPFFPTVITPDDEEPIRDASILFDVAVDPVNGNLYAVWQDARFSGFEIDQVAFSMSTDNGSTWSVPIKVSQSPADANILKEQAFVPSVAVADGVVGVSYYDFRNDDGSGELADHWLVACGANCSDAASWTPGNEVRLTNTSFDYTLAPLTGAGFFLGDYVGLASDGSDFLPFFQQSSVADPGDGFFRRVTP